jgi:hypothetical protein
MFVVLTSVMTTTDSLTLERPADIQANAGGQVAVTVASSEIVLFIKILVEQATFPE